MDAAALTFCSSLCSPAHSSRVDCQPALGASMIASTQPASSSSSNSLLLAALMPCNHCCLLLHHLCTTGVTQTLFVSSTPIKCGAGLSPASLLQVPASCSCILPSSAIQLAVTVSSKHRACPRVLHLLPNPHPSPSRSPHHPCPPAATCTRTLLSPPLPGPNTMQSCTCKSYAPPFPCSLVLLLPTHMAHTTWL